MLPRERRTEPSAQMSAKKSHSPGGRTVKNGPRAVGNVEVIGTLSSLFCITARAVFSPGSLTCFLTSSLPLSRAVFNLVWTEHIPDWSSLFGHKCLTQEPLSHCSATASHTLSSLSLERSNGMANHRAALDETSQSEGAASTTTCSC